MKLIRHALLVSLAGLALAVPGLDVSSAAPAAERASVKATASACPGSIRMGGKRFAFYKHRVTCTGARRSVRLLYETRGRRGTPRGFKCRSLSRFRKTGGCRNSTRTRYFGFSS